MFVFDEHTGALRRVLGSAKAVVLADEPMRANMGSGAMCDDGFEPIGAIASRVMVAVTPTEPVRRDLRRRDDRAASSAAFVKGDDFGHFGQRYDDPACAGPAQRLPDASIRVVNLPVVLGPGEEIRWPGIIENGQKSGEPKPAGKFCREETPKEGDVRVRVTNRDTTGKRPARIRAHARN